MEMCIYIYIVTSETPMQTDYTCSSNPQVKKTQWSTQAILKIHAYQPNKIQPIKTLCWKV